MEIIAPDEYDEEDQVQVQEESSGSGNFYLPKLKILKLWHLADLEIFCKSRKAMMVDYLQDTYICHRPNLKRISFLDKELHACSLEKIYVEKEWKSLEWDHPEARNFLQPFRIWIG